ncbi:hypothetical protein [Terasakiella brassicae]|uniref:hypothetical protein n=1 Tax=Terasakiella brassicae TaxID=1634917 RepID=UPI001E2E9719|nr:hypothetical protein [Terasakiella brassicae]
MNSFVSLCQSEIEGIPDAIRYFFQANCFNALGQAKHKNSEDRLSWQQDESVLQVLALRRAIAHPSFIEVNDIWKCKIYTNLGNCLNFLGRICEAIRQWDHALEIIPNFAMALGNRGQCLLILKCSCLDSWGIPKSFKI